MREEQTPIRWYLVNSNQNVRNDTDLTSSLFDCFTVLLCARLFQNTISFLLGPVKPVAQLSYIRPEKTEYDTTFTSELVAHLPVRADGRVTEQLCTAPLCYRCAGAQQHTAHDPTKLILPSTKTYSLKHLTKVIDLKQMTKSMSTSFILS